MTKDAFAHVETWVFDLDNTLYHPSARLFDQIDRRMTAFIVAELGLSRTDANALRARYWREYGATLAGLMANNGVEPKSYLEYVHDIDLSAISPTPPLAEAIGRLPGRKIVHTNGSLAHARRITRRLGLAEAFDGLYGIECAGYAPKPARAAYERIFAAADIDPARAAMIEDTARNLIEPHAMGMVTVWTPTGDDKAHESANGAHVHHVAEDLTKFLTRLIGQEKAPHGAGAISAA